MKFNQFNVANLSDGLRQGVEQAMDHIDVVSAIGLVLQRQKRLAELYRNMEGKEFKAPNGFRFAITTIGDQFEIATLHQNYDSYILSRWETAQALEIPRVSHSPLVFIAQEIAVIKDGNEIGDVYAYSIDGQMRCRITEDKYSVGLLANDVPVENLITLSDVNMANSRVSAR